MQMKQLLRPKVLVAVNLVLIVLSSIGYRAWNQASIDFEDFMHRSKSLGYHVEEHFVETEDGFVISIHRIHGKESNASTASTASSSPADALFQIKSKKPILMGHGLGGSSDMFIRNTAETSLAYKLANEGHDVFLMNSRGNSFSHRHVSLSRDTAAYWDFSFEEMAKYDLPAVAEYIHDVVYEKTEKLNYIGHSQGCTIVLAALSEQYVSSDFFDKIILITPASIQKNVNAPVQNLIKNVDFLPVLREFGLNEFLRMNKLNYLACKMIPMICQVTLSLVTDTNESPINHDEFYKLMLYYPAGTSTKAYIHFNQINTAKRFQHFDYGVAENIKRYNSTDAPEFNLANIVNPVHIIAGDHDMATPLSDILHLKSALVNAKNVTLKVYDEGHCSFIVGTNNAYQPYLLEMLEA